MPGWGYSLTAVWFCVGQGLGEGTMPLPGFWRFVQPSPCFQSLHLLSVCNWHPSSSCPGGETQSGWVCLCLCGPCKLWKYGSLFPLLQPPLVFQLGVMGIYLPDFGTLGWAVWPRAGIACSQSILVDFYPPHVNLGLSVPPLLLPLCATSPLPASLQLCPSYPSG